MDDDFNVNSYWYELPEEKIAQFPPLDQARSKLLILQKSQGKNIEDSIFENIGNYLPDNALLIVNNSKVFSARLFGKRENGGKLEFLMLTPFPVINEKVIKAGNSFSANVECLLKPASRIHVGMSLDLAPDLQAVVLKKLEYGKHEITLQWKGNLEEIFNKYGKLPLPPYIKREAGTGDVTTYQTCYAKNTGSVAAPTAGLHFTPEIKASLEKKGVEWQEITLHVGYGTFSPVRCDDIREHKMHSEYVEIPEIAAYAINNAMRERRPIFTIGTTSMRTLEGVFEKEGEILPWKGWLDTFLYPGCTFNVVNGLVTNFHLPKSTLLMLVSAFGGRTKILQAYDHALKNGYRFFSYGDSMLIY